MIGQHEDLGGRKIVHRYECGAVRRMLDRQHIAIPISIAPPRHSAKSFRRGFNRQALAFSSKIAATAGTACGRSHSFPRLLPHPAALHARRSSVSEDMPLGDFMLRCEAYFAAEGCIVDQPFQLRLPNGMIRCYMVGDKVVGFGHQLIKALIPPPEDADSEAAQPGRSTDSIHDGDSEEMISVNVT
jgi:hypothetical protein